MLKLLKIHNFGPKINIFAGGIYLVMNASLYLSKESILFQGEEKNQIFTRAQKEKGWNIKKGELKMLMKKFFYYNWTWFPYLIGWKSKKKK